MVHLRLQSIICLELHNKVTNSFPKRCNLDDKSESIWNALVNALKIRLEMDAKYGHLKNERVNFLVHLVLHKKLVIHKRLQTEQQ